MSTNSPNSFKDHSTPGSADDQALSSTGSMPLLTKLSRPFLTQNQLEHLRTLTELSGPKFNSMLLHAFDQIWSIAQVYNFPMKTIGTAMLLFQKTYLFNRVQNFPPTETTIACLMIASKIEDTPKKARELLQTSYYIKGVTTSSTQLEEVRKQVLSLERQILETIGFDFRIRHPQPYIIKFAKEMAVSREDALIAWNIAIDSYVTDACLRFPCHVVALACLFLATKLNEFDVLPKMNFARFFCKKAQLKGAILDLLEFYSHSLSASRLGKINRSIDASTFINIRIDINKQFRNQNKPEPHGSVEGLFIRDPKLSDKGTVRYILDWERGHVSGEPLI